MTTPPATVIIPAHNRADSLRLATASARQQTVADVEVLIVGDGVTDDVRTAATALAADPHVRFLDQPKGRGHGEPYRHDAIQLARSDAIFYLCDDDVLMPEHVEDLLGLLETHNFVQALNGWLRPDGSVGRYPADLSDPDTLAWHLRDDTRYNAVGITGTAHSKRFYETVGTPWSETPVGEWPDHHQWRKMLRHPDFNGATSQRMTILQFPTSSDGRDSWTNEERLEELRRWFAFSRELGAQSVLDALVAKADRVELERITKLYVQARTERDLYRDNYEEILLTRSWRLTQPLRRLRGLL